MENTLTVQSVKEEALAYVGVMEIPSTGWKLVPTSVTTRDHGSVKAHFIRRENRVKVGGAFETASECPVGSQLRRKLLKGDWKTAWDRYELCPSPRLAAKYLDASSDALSMIIVAADGRIDSQTWFEPIGTEPTLPDYVGEDVEDYDEAKSEVRRSLLRKCGINNRRKTS